MRQKNKFTAMILRRFMTNAWRILSKPASDKELFFILLLIPALSYIPFKMTSSLIDNLSTSMIKVISFVLLAFTVFLLFILYKANKK